MVTTEESQLELVRKLMGGNKICSATVTQYQFGSPLNIHTYRFIRDTVKFCLGLPLNFYLTFSLIETMASINRPL